MNKKFNLLFKSTGRGNTFITFSTPYTSHKPDADGKEHTIYLATHMHTNDGNNPTQWAIDILVHDDKGPRYSRESFITDAVNMKEGELYDWLMSQI